MQTLGIQHSRTVAFISSLMHIFIEFFYCVNAGETQRKIENCTSMYCMFPYTRTTESIEIGGPEINMTIQLQYKSKGENW